MKTLLAASLLITSAFANPISWQASYENTLETAARQVAASLPNQTAIVGRTGLTTTRVAVFISAEGHLLAPFLKSIDGTDTPYLLYHPDGRRLPLITVSEKPKRAVALLKLDSPLPDLQPVKVSTLASHTVLIPHCAPLASLGEIPSLIIDHLPHPPAENARTFKLDHNLYSLGSPVLDLAGQLVGITLKPTETHTPVLFLNQLLPEIPEIDSLLAQPTPPVNPNLPLAPPLPPADEDEDQDEAEKKSPLTEARAAFLFDRLPASLPCVHIFNEDSPTTHSIIGTIIRQDGMILTKASELGPKLRVRFNSQNYPAILLNTDEETDLALIAIDATNLPTISWHSGLPTPGSILTSPVLLQETSTDMISEPSTTTGTFTQLIPKNTPLIHASSQVTSLGLTTEQTESGLTIAAISPDSPAAESDLSLGDLILAVNEQKTPTRQELASFLAQQKVGDEVTLTLRRKDSEVQTPLTLVAPNLIPPPTGIDPQEGLAMVPSVRRAPFPDVLSHTLPLNAWDCGSPLFDSQNRALGLNIAAAAPGHSLALPAPEIQAALTRLLRQSRPF